MHLCDLHCRLADGKLGLCQFLFLPALLYGFSSAGNDFWRGVAQKKRPNGASQPRFGTLSYRDCITQQYYSDYNEQFLRIAWTQVSFSCAHWRETTTIWFWPLFVATISGASRDQEVLGRWYISRPNHNTTLRFAVMQRKSTRSIRPKKHQQKWIGVESNLYKVYLHITSNIHMICSIHNIFVYGIVYAKTALFSAHCVCLLLRLKRCRLNGQGNPSYSSYNNGYVDDQVSFNKAGYQLLIPGKVAMIPLISLLEKPEITYFSNKVDM